MAKLYLIPTPVGNLEDITLRALRILKEVPLVLAEDTRTSAKLLKHYEINTPLLSHHKFNEHQQVNRIAERIARKTESMALITGESIGQVASQTMEALNVTDSVVSMPVFRPLIGSDKEEIIEVARKIGTFETSSLPYEDCCTVFTPRHPATHPKMEKINLGESRLDLETLLDEAVENTEVVSV